MGQVVDPRHQKPLGQPTTKYEVVLQNILVGNTNLIRGIYMATNSIALFSNKVSKQKYFFQRCVIPLMVESLLRPFCCHEKIKRQWKKWNVTMHQVISNSTLIKSDAYYLKTSIDYITEGGCAYSRASQYPDTLVDRRFVQIMRSVHSRECWWLKWSVPSAIPMNLMMFVMTVSNGMSPIRCQTHCGDYVLSSMIWKK